ncbi:uncharacterized protein [Ptychodera flava]|uniref:uncharacterized protein n=1 Tax=Ptychodera flava TaxID=63121 RepID=UPI003969DF1F
MDRLHRILRMQQVSPTTDLTRTTIHPGNLRQGGAPLGYPPQGGPARQGCPPTDGGNVQGVDNPMLEGEVPDDDVKAPQPTVPTVEKMDQVSGYDNMQGAPLPPPSANEAVMQSSNPEQSEVIPKMSLVRIECTFLFVLKPKSLLGQHGHW